MIVEMPSEGMLDDDTEQSYLVLVPRPLLQYGSTHGRQIVLQMTMSLENRPKDIGHGEDDSDERYIWEGGPLLSLPKQGPAIPAARTTLRFAGVIADPLFRLSLIHI